MMGSPTGERAGPDTLGVLLGGGHILHASRLVEALPLAGPVVALDVFDTLVERSIRPEHTKVLACDRLARIAGVAGEAGPELYARRQRIERELGRRSVAENGEAEFRLADMAAALYSELRAARLLPAGLEETAFVAAALRAELMAERAVLRAKPGVLTALQAAREAGVRVLLVSDFYLPAEALAELLAGVGIAPPLYEALHVSCDRGASKRSGRLYDLVLTEVGCPPGDVTMFGDNPHSDLAMAQSRGLRAVLVEDTDRVAVYAAPDAEVTAPARLAAQMCTIVEARDVPPAHLRHAVPSLLLFAERLYTAARRRGLRHLFFLAREGQPLLAMFEAWQDAMGLRGEDRVATHYLIASRRACYVASLAPLAAERFEGLFRQYRRISLRDFARSLGLEGAVLEAVAARHGLDLDATEEDLPESAAYQTLRSDPDFAAFYEARRIAQRDALRDYVASFGVDLRAHPLAVVDCGWKGSIQDFLRGAMPPEVEVEGFYLGLIHAGQDVLRKTGLLFSNVGSITPDYHVFAENPSLFEVLLCADHGSAISYERRPDGLVEVRLDDDPAERAFLEGTVMPVARDAMAVFRELAAARAMVVLSEASWERMVADMHARLVFRPWLDQAAWLLAARHRESFGVFHLSEITCTRATSPAERLRFMVRLLREPRRVLNGSFWPASTLYAHGGRPLVEAYAMARRLLGRLVRAKAPVP